MHIAYKSKIEEKHIMSEGQEDGTKNEFDKSEFVRIEKWILRSYY